MNRNRGIICIILGILVCGVLLTSFNSRMLKKQQEEMARDEVIREAAYGNEAAYGGEAGYGAVNSRMYVGSAAARKEEISPASAGEQETELQPGEEEESAPVPSDSGQDGAAAEGAEPAEAEEDLTGESPAQPSAEAAGEASPAPAAFFGGEAVISPEDGGDAEKFIQQSEAESVAADEGAGPGMALAESSGTMMVPEKKTAEDFRRRLEEVDQQIADQRAANAAYTTYDMLNMAENERQLWDSELNHIYSTIKRHIPADREEALVKDERAWIARRDAKAAEDAGRYEGGTLESVEYTASLAASTRARAYELVELYGEYLW